MNELLKIVNAPAVLAVNPESVRGDLRIQHFGETEFICHITEAAIAYCEDVVGKKFILQTWDYLLSNFYCKTIYLPFAPAKELISIEYFDLQNIARVLDLNDFYFYATEDIAFIEPKNGVNWPQVFPRRDAVKIRFSCGYGATPEEIPANISRAIRLLACHFYETRSGTTPNFEMKAIPFGIENLLGASRIKWVG